MTKKLLVAAAAAALAVPVVLSVGATPARAAPFCSTYPDGQGFRECGMSYPACARMISGIGGTCVQDPNVRRYYGYGYEESYAYAPAEDYGPPPGPAFGFAVGAY